MAMASCTTCKKEISKEASSCPHCGQPIPTMNPKARVLFSLVVLGLFAWWFFGGGMTSHVENSVLQQALAQYQIAWRSNDRAQSCAQAGIVTNLYLQAKDEANYNHWLAVEKKECKSLGMPQ